MSDQLQPQNKDDMPNDSAGSNAIASKQTKDSKKTVSKIDRRLNYLLKQAEILHHFVSNGTKAKEDEKRAKKRAAPNALLDPAKKYSKQNDGSHSAARNEEQVKQYDKTPRYIDGEMRDFQLLGLNWLISIYENGINGILGDEMGLGKTLQSISIMGYLKHVKQIDGPFLVISPLSTLRNWLNEVNRFCPSLDAFIMYGGKNDRPPLIKKLKSQSGWDVCITSYEQCKSEIHVFKRIHWKYVVLDEGHKIKNSDSQVNKAMHTIKSDSRLLLTGTPLQNNLHELWSLLNYLLPDLFSSANDFDTWFDSDECLRGNDDTVQRLHAILKPFMLRRVKADVESSLLPKNELKLYIGMTQLQLSTYKKVLLKDIQVIRSGEITSKKIQQIFMELRKSSNHPYLVEGIEPEPFTTDRHLVDSCGKMIVCDQLLAKLKSQGSRVVLFSQFVIMLDIIEDYLDWKGYKFLRLDGQTPVEQRATDIDTYNAEGSDVFIYLISTRAGSLGINLATADTVIIYDSDWNPQADFQAIDRVHRIGQKKQVNIFRLITENTIDQRIVQRAEIKKRLDEVVIKSNGNSQKEDKPMSKEVLMDVIKDADKITNEAVDANFDLKTILEKSERRAAEEKEKADKMTLGEASGASSIYHFDGVDFRNKRNIH